MVPGHSSPGKASHTYLFDVDKFSFARFAGSGLCTAPSRKCSHLNLEGRSFLLAIAHLHSPYTKRLARVLCDLRRCDRNYERPRKIPLRPDVGRWAARQKERLRGSRNGDLPLLSHSHLRWGNAPPQFRTHLAEV